MTGFDLKPNSYVILRAITENHSANSEGLPMAEIADKTGLNMRTVRRHLPKLRALGLISYGSATGRSIGRGQHYRFTVYPKAYNVLRRAPL
jgi:DNA-binding IclR family transcriptional regulator